MSEGNGNHHVETELSRDLGLPSALAIGIGTMIAAGIFTLSGLAVGYVGSSAIIAFVLSAMIAGLTALTYCEFASIYPESGEGYLYARRTFAAPLAYLVGWCLLLGYTASCAFYIASLSTYFNEFIWHSPFEMMAGLVTIVALTLLNVRGTKESGRFQIIVTIAKVVLLIWFVAGGLMHLDTQLVMERFSDDFQKIGSTAALVFVTFFGFSAIAASAGEVVNPTKTIPRAIFISMGVVTVLYSLVVLVVVTANLTEYDEAAMGQAARNFLGPIGGMVIIAGALFSMISASNATIMACSRVALSMSRRGHLPQEIGTINARTRTPVIAVILTGGAIGAFAVLLPLEELAHFADCVLLVVLILVNIALIKHRRMYPHLNRAFRVPLVPVLPALGILANLYLLTQVASLTPMLLSAAAIVIGLLGFLAWKGSQTVETLAMPGEPSQVALEETATEERPYRVLIAVANPASIDRLVDLAAAVAHRRHGTIVAVSVALVPDQMPPSVGDISIEREKKLLDQARKRAKSHDVPLTSVVRVGHNAARAILETAREHSCDLIVVGWKGSASTTRHIMGEITDAIVHHAQTDIMLVKMVDKPSAGKGLLLPTAGGDHARRAAEYAACIAAARDCRLKLCAILGADAFDEQLESEQTRLQKECERITETEAISVDSSIIRDRSVSEAIIGAAEEFDSVIIGASGQSFSNQILFGTIPEAVAQASEKEVIVIKCHDRVKALFGRVMSE